MSEPNLLEAELERVSLVQSLIDRGMREEQANAAPRVLNHPMLREADGRQEDLINASLLTSGDWTWIADMLDDDEWEEGVTATEVVSLWLRDALTFSDRHPRDYAVNFLDDLWVFHATRDSLAGTIARYQRLLEAADLFGITKWLEEWM